MTGEATSDIELIVAEDEATLASIAADRIAAALRDAVAARGRATIALSGGGTPRPTYEALATRDVPWSAVTIAWVDERFVPWSSERSNFGEANRAWLRSLPIDRARIHPMPEPLAGAFDADAADWAAGAYERTLRAVTATPDGSVPVIDVAVMGAGPDGHTASLFPGDPALAERERAVTAVRARATGEPREPRITLTYPVLLAARLRVALATGAAKRPIVAAALSGPLDALPIARLREAEGPTLFVVDRAAAPI